MVELALRLGEPWPRRRGSRGAARPAPRIAAQLRQLHLRLGAQRFELLLRLLQAEAGLVDRWTAATALLCTIWAARSKVAWASCTAASCAAMSRCMPLVVGLHRAEVQRGLLQLRLGLLHGALERRGVELHQHLAGLHPSPSCTAMVCTMPATSVASSSRSACT